MFSDARTYDIYEKMAQLSGSLDQRFVICGPAPFANMIE